MNANNYPDSRPKERYATWNSLLHDSSQANSDQGTALNPSLVQPSFPPCNDEANQVIRRVSRYFSLYLLSPRGTLQMARRAAKRAMYLTPLLRTNTIVVVSHKGSMGRSIHP